MAAGQWRPRQAGLAESRSRDSRLGDWAKMSDSATRRFGDSGLTRAVIRPQDRVPQDHLRSHCNCASSFDAQPKQAS